MAEVAVAVVAVVVADSAVFEVLDVLGGATELIKPNATLDGSLPVRAVRACSPLLDGNRFGFQVKLTQTLTFTKTLTGVKIAALPDVLSRAVSGSMPRVLAEGLLDRQGEWAQSFAGGIVFRERGARRKVSLFTGLFIKPRKGYWLRIGHAGNRRNIAFSVDERWIADSNTFTPLIVTMTFEREAMFPLLISGEIATLAPFVPGNHFDQLAGHDVEALGHAHTKFFDEKYFAQKKRGSTKNYRHMIDREPEPTLPDAQHAGFAVLGPGCIERETNKVFLTPRGTQSRAPVDHAGVGIEELIFHNAVPLACSFDGHHTHVDPDKSALDRFAKKTQNAWTAVFGAEYLEKRRGAMWYFTKYVTPHQPGEPYFFVKPPALISTPQGHSALIEGIPGQGYSVLRGVVAMDSFHAAPAVFRIDQPLRRIDIAEGAALTKIIPFPRNLLDATFATVDWAHAPRLRETR